MALNGLKGSSLRYYRARSLSALRREEKSAALEAAAWTPAALLLLLLLGRLASFFAKDVTQADWAAGPGPPRVKAGRRRRRLSKENFRKTKAAHFESMSEFMKIFILEDVHVSRSILIVLGRGWEIPVKSVADRPSPF